MGRMLRRALIALAPVAWSAYRRRRRRRTAQAPRT
jgi:hypothetical protein